QKNLRKKNKAIQTKLILKSRKKLSRKTFKFKNYKNCCLQKMGFKTNNKKTRYKETYKTVCRKIFFEIELWYETSASKNYKNSNKRNKIEK
ncbi:MAG: hypothetical protein ACP5E7_06075, partial [Hydrogenobaculum sp.]